MNKVIDEAHCIPNVVDVEKIVPVYGRRRHKKKPSYAECLLAEKHPSAYRAFKNLFPNSRKVRKNLERNHVSLQWSIGRAKTMLEHSHHVRLKDDYFGDSEHYFYLGDFKVAEGYLGSTGTSIVLYNGVTFYDGEADELIRSVKISRTESNND